MEDSKIWWYLILGAIYMISKFLKKKKPENQPDQNQEEVEEYQQEEDTPTQNKPSSIEEILRELSQGAESRKEPEPKADPIPERIPEPIETYSREARPLPSQMENIEAIKPFEEIDIVPHTELVRDKPEYGRSESFKIKEEVNEIADDIHNTFQDAEGAKKAFLYGEVFNRRY